MQQVPFNRQECPIACRFHLRCINAGCSRTCLQWLGNRGVTSEHSALLVTGMRRGDNPSGRRFT
jgi:hypothetical protein